MEIGYYFAFDSTDTTGLGRYGVTIAKGFGLIFFAETNSQWYIKGAVIGGKLYGDTTNVITSLNNEELIIPQNLELLPNYPNPFNPQTTIPFRLNSQSNISLTIYGNTGSEVQQLIDNMTYSAGEYSVTWDGKDNKGKKAASGIYFYSLISNHTKLTRSMILLK
jgi:hypothetical protein